jgi:hypothetical protein
MLLPPRSPMHSRSPTFRCRKCRRSGRCLACSLWLLDASALTYPPMTDDCKNADSSVKLILGPFLKLHYRGIATRIAA